MGSLKKEQLRETIINAEYVDFLLGLMRKYTGDVSIPEILYYEVLYTSKYLKKHGIMEEAQTIMGVWLESTDPGTLTQDEIRGIEKKQLSSRKMKLEEYRASGGVEYYIKNNKLKLTFLLILIVLLVSPLGIFEFKAVNTLFRVVMTLLFVVWSMGIIMDLLYISLPVFRLNEGSENLVSSNAVDACDEKFQYVNAISVQDKVRYMSNTKEYRKSLSKFKQNTFEYYDKVSDIELEIHEKEVTSDGEDK